MKKALILVFLVLLAGVVYANDDFDCKTLGITVDKCYNQGGIFKAEFSILGIKAPGSYNKIIDPIKGVDYILDANKQYETANGDVVARGTLPKGYKLTNIDGNKYSLEANMGDNEVNSLRVAYTKDDLYQYTFEMERCYAEAGKLGVDMYGFKICSNVAAEENKVTAKVIQDNEITGNSAVTINIKDPEQDKRNIILYSVIFGVILLIAVLVFVFRKKLKTK